MKKLFLFFLMLGGIMSCEDPAHLQEFGSSLLYIPQAMVQSGNDNNDYTVVLDSSMNADTSIVLGLYRAGLAPLESVSVDVSIDSDSLSEAMTKGLITNAILLDPSYYSIPSQLSLLDGERSSINYITLHKSMIWSDSNPSDIRYVLPVRISNPTRYEINPDISLCMFIISRNK